MPLAKRRTGEPGAPRRGGSACIQARGMISSGRRRWNDDGQGAENTAPGSGGWHALEDGLATPTTASRARRWHGRTLRSRREKTRRQPPGRAQRAEPGRRYADGARDAAARPRMAPPRAAPERTRAGAGRPRREGRSGRQKPRPAHRRAAATTARPSASGSEIRRGVCRAAYNQKQKNHAATLRAAQTSFSVAIGRVIAVYGNSESTATATRSQRRWQTKQQRRASHARRGGGVHVVDAAGECGERVERSSTAATTSRLGPARFVQSQRDGGQHQLELSDLSTR